MKKIIKNPIFTFILGALIFGGIVGVSAYTILANDIGYTPKDSTWKKSNGEDITNVKDAIDELYSKASLVGWNLNYDILYKKDQTSSIDYSYIISEDDTKYKSIMVIVETNNTSMSYAPAYITITNDNIVPILDPDEMSYTEYSQYRITTDIYVGYINNIVKDDVIRIQGYYGVRMLILGIK